MTVDDHQMRTKQRSNSSVTDRTSTQTTLIWVLRTECGNS